MLLALVPPTEPISYAWIQLVLLAVSLVLFVVSEFINKPDIENAKPQGLGDVQAPTASETRAVPILWGTRDIKGPNVIWYGDFRTAAVKRKVKTGWFSSKNVTVGFRYFIGMDLLLCYGPIDRVTRLEISDRVAYSGPAIGPFGDSSEQMVVSEPDLFGGEEKGGGVSGTIDIFGGLPNQDKSDYLINSGPGGGDSGNIPAYVDIAHAVARQFEVGESPSIGPYVFRVSRFPNNLGLTGSNHIVNGTVEDGDANPAEVIYEILTSGVFGLNIDPGNIDTQSFIDAGNALASEGLGVSMITDRIQRASEVIKAVLEMTDGVLFQDAEDKFSFKLVRDDFGAVGSLELYDETNVIQVQGFSRSSWSETNNHVDVKYTDRGKDNIQTSAMAQDLANFRTTGQENRIDRAIPALGTAAGARIVAERELLQLSFPIAKITLDVNRDGQKLRPGDVIRWSWSDYGITDMVLRVLAVDLGELFNGVVTIECVQDVFRISETIYANPQATGWVPIDTDAVAFTDEIVRSVPRIYLNRTFANEGVFDPELGQRVHSMAKRPSSAVVEFEQFVDLGAGAGFEGERGETGAVAPAGELSADYDAGTAAIDAAGFTLTSFDGVADLENLTDPSQVSSGFNLALIEGATGDGSDDEIVGWESFTDNGGGSVSFTDIHRGLMDTVPRDHSAGARVFLFSLGQAITESTYGPTQAITVKHQPKTPNDELDIASASALPLTFPDRLRRPHHPANFTVNGTRVPEAVDESADLDFDWLHRTNDETDIRDSDTGSPNAQDTEVEYDLEFRHGVTGAVLRNETLVSPTPAWLTFLYTQASLQSDTGEVGDFPLRVLMQSRYAAGASNNPPNLTSLAQSNRRFNVDMGGSALQSVDLNGTDEYIRTNQAARGYTDSFSWEIWIKFNTLGSATQTIGIFKADANDNSRIALNVQTALLGQPFRLRLWDSGGTKFKDFDFGAVPSAGTWTQLGFSFDGTTDTLTVIQDGSDVTGSATLTTDNAGAQANTSGRHWSGVGAALGGGFLDGRVWRWGAWSKALSAAEFAALYNSGNGDAVNPRFDFGAYSGMDDLVHLWDFRDTSNPGQDFGNSTSLQDIFSAGQNVDATDLVADTP